MSGNIKCRQKNNDFKVIVLGESNVGKTSLIARYISGNFTPNVKSTLGVHFNVEKAVVDEGEAWLQIWDTAGKERFDAISKSYCRNAKAAIICVDVTNERSYVKMNFWINEMMLNEPDCKLYICSTKCDLWSKRARTVSEELIETRADECRAKIFVTSSKSGDGVFEMFQQIASDLLQSNTVTDNGTVRLDSFKNSRRRKCCSRN